MTNTIIAATLVGSAMGFTTLGAMFLGTWLGNKSAERTIRKYEARHKRD